MLVAVRCSLCCVLFRDYCSLFGVRSLVSRCVSFAGCGSLCVVCCRSCLLMFIVNKLLCVAVVFVVLVFVCFMLRVDGCSLLVCVVCCLLFVVCS